MLPDRLRTALSCLSLAVLSAPPCVAHAQNAFRWEAAAGVAIPTGGCSDGRGVGPAGHLALRLARPAMSVTFGALADVGYMPGETLTVDGLGNPAVKSALRVSTFAATTHFESPSARPGAFAEIGAGVSWLRLTDYGVSSTAPMLLGGVGVRLPVGRVPLRFGLQYHLYGSDLAAGRDVSPTQSARLSVGIGRR